MRLIYVKEAAVAELRRAIEKNADKYRSDGPWLESFFGDRAYLADSRIDLLAMPELTNPEGSALYELENTIALHGALKDLTPSQAADERLWVYLAHAYYWDYMRKRWPMEKATNLKSYILEHYFVGSARDLVRQGIARLWWFGYATYDASASDPYALTRLLLHTTDTRQSLMERTFWRNQSILRALLTRVEYWREKGIDLYPRDRFRKLCMSFNTYGGTLLLDALTDSDIFAMVDDAAAIESKEKGPALVHA